MRVLERNKRTIHYQNPTGKEIELKDSKGFYTGEKVPEFTPECEWRVNYTVDTTSNGEYIATFGSITDYDLVMACVECPLVEGAKVVASGTKYKVVKIVESLNGYRIALKEQA